MLINLYIKNFGLIDLLIVDLQNGLNIITGETGAGKSIIIEALQVALGGRAAAGEQIRAGSERMWIQATFDINNNKKVILMLEEQGVGVPEDSILILTREINRSGKNVCRLNGQTVTLSCYRGIGRNLVDSHVQHEQHSLLDQNRHRELLDRFGGALVTDTLKEVTNLYSLWKETFNTFKKLSRNDEERVKQADLLRYEINEIEKIDPKPGEDEELASEKKVLVNAEKICLLAAESYSLIYEGTHGQAPVTDLLSKAMDLLKNLALLDEHTEHLYKSLESVFYQVEDAARELAVLNSKVEHDPQRLEAVEERLELLNNLKNKYAPTIPEIFDYLAKARDELEKLENKKELAATYAEELKKIEQSYMKAAEILSSRRLQAAEKLEEEVSRELVDLEMGRVKFQVVFTRVDGLSPGGAERVEFLISPNPGEPLKPLAKIASGGELSRIMLALKALLAEADDIPVIIFDEVDAGIGGRSLHAVAEKLAKISKHHQIICVTHAAQVASFASVHYRVRKEFDGERTVTKVDKLALPDRVDELARMLGGKEVTDISRRHARQMLSSASKNLASEGIS
ncbi:MAG: DNA repair protein RecN [Pelotomaculum sp. PtaB.Bin013]|uniref:DNA repair protein RecN n=1 Tax=Pelotomaculum isophthalicicum JI TaxID=947010 RepID=A0A9X4JSV0_9FIRM|nr:DNA repair protein RecN [Pelotomaculum isophthalicicum]MDF9407464.1 DNA repair protein RecN [Pelotomaculum isophthalicicum JI]OPX92008.1 MAG: DNA repair protein RecN [Pelotomaculum sp. PtaB.Bin013]